MHQRILVALDGSDNASRALDAALDLAAGSGAQLMPLYVIDVPIIAFDVPGFDPSIIGDGLAEEGKRIAADAQSRMARRSVTGTARVMQAGLPGEDVAHCIVTTASQWNADLIVIGTHGRRGFRRLVLGSVAERVLRSACCPVLTIPARAAGPGAEPAVPAQTSADKEPT